MARGDNKGREGKKPKQVGGKSKPPSAYASSQATAGAATPFINKNKKK